MSSRFEVTGREGQRGNRIRMFTKRNCGRLACMSQTAKGERLWPSLDSEEGAFGGGKNQKLLSAERFSPFINVLSTVVAPLQRKGQCDDDVAPLWHPSSPLQLSLPRFSKLFSSKEEIL